MLREAVRTPLIMFMSVAVAMQLFMVYVNHELAGSNALLASSRDQVDGVIAVLVVALIAATALIALLAEDLPMYGCAMLGWVLVGITGIYYTHIPSQESTAWRWGLAVQGMIVLSLAYNARRHNVSLRRRQLEAKKCHN